ncbi:MAG TPA: hypothetical protein VF585_03965 [Chthoniobacterales bacterium]|jgi:hypothetical protein
MDQILILLVIGLVALVRKLVFEGGFAAMMKKLNGELNEPNPDYRRATPPPVQHHKPAARPASANPEEERMRKFREALGLPEPEAASPQPRSFPTPKTYPVPPIVATPPRRQITPGDRARAEKERIERALAEKQRELQARVQPPVVRQPKPEQTTAPRHLEPAQPPPVTPSRTMVETNVDASDEIADPVPLSVREENATSGSVLNDIFGNSTDLRRMILAQEILGRPKSLQSS